MRRCRRNFQALVYPLDADYASRPDYRRVPFPRLDRYLDGGHLTSDSAVITLNRILSGELNPLCKRLHTPTKDDSFQVSDHA